MVPISIQSFVIWYTFPLMNKARKLEKGENKLIGKKNGPIHAFPTPREDLAFDFFGLWIQSFDSFSLLPTRDLVSLRVFEIQSSWKSNMVEKLEKCSIEIFEWVVWNGTNGIFSRKIRKSKTFFERLGKIVFALNPTHSVRCTCKLSFVSHVLVQDKKTNFEAWNVPN